MNNLFSKYSKRFMGLAMASLVFSACEKEEFSEADALDLELQRLRLQDSIATAKNKLDNDQAIGMMRYQRALDSLDRINSGGLVYYSVTPVKATNAVFAAGGGRTEEVQGEEGLKVTIAQYGRVIQAGGNDDNPGTVIVGEPNLTGSGALNGVYTFPALRSGEITVDINGEDEGLSNVTYTVNLTPDGAVANGQVVYVSNVIPVFEISDDRSKMATVRGKAFYENDLTNGVEEFVGQQDDDPSSTRQLPSSDDVTVTANIDVEGATGGRGSVFWDRYLKQTNDEGFGISNDTDGNNGTSYGTNGKTMSGYIQRFGYELSSLPTATLGSVADNDGVLRGGYSMLVPSTSSGLPIRLKFSEFAADRTFYREGKLVTTRHTYGPNVAPDNVDNGVKLPEFVFQAYDTEATGTATYTKADYSGKLKAKNTKNELFLTAGNASGDAQKTTFEGLNGSTSIGFFAVSSTDKTKWPSLAPKAGNATAEVSKVSTVGDGAGFTVGLGLQQIETALLTNVGSDYTDESNGTEIDGTKSGKELEFNVTRNDVISIGTASVNGSTSGGLTNVQITNSGFGFRPPSGSTSSVNDASFTGYHPDVIFSAPGTGTNNAADGKAVIDESTGIITHIIITNPGRNYTGQATVSLRNGTDFSWTASSTTNVAGWAGEPLLMGSDGNIYFNTAYSYNGGGTLSPASTALVRSMNDVDGKYAFLPSLGITLSNTLNNNAVSNKLSEYLSTTRFNVLNVGSAFTTGTGGSSFLTVDTNFGKADLAIAGGATSSFASASVSTPTDFVTVFGVENNIRLYSFTSVLLVQALGATASASGISMANIGTNLALTSQPDNSGFAAVANVGGGGLGVDQYRITATDANYKGLLVNGTIGNNAIDNPSSAIGSNNSTFITTAGQGLFTPYNNPGLFNDGYLVNNTSSKAHFVSAAPFLVQATGSDISKYAWGVPNFNAAGKIEGIRWAETGSGYVTNPSTPYNIVLVPNLYQDYAANSGQADALWPSNNDLESQIKRTMFAGRVYAQYDKLDAQLSLNITNGGEGYATKPRVVIVKDGADFSGQAIMAVSQAIEGRLIVDSKGAVTVKDTDGDGNPNELKEGIINIDGLEGTTIGGIAVPANLSDAWDRYLDNGAKTAEYNLVFIDRLSESIGMQFNSVTGRTTNTNSGVLWVSEGGELMLDMEKMVNGKKAWQHLPSVSYNYKPVVKEIKSDEGQDATAETEIFLTDGTFDNAEAWSIKVKLTSGGSGYARGNQYYNRGDSDYHDNNATGAGQGFRILGGFDGASNDNVASESNMRFDAFTGITYVRDVHYGTGKETE